jgi:hypothetical protein
MIIVAMARSGATKICMDLAEKNNLQFVGELTATNLYDSTRYRKDKDHETNFEIAFDPELWTKIINRDPSLCILANHAKQYTLLKDADYVILRKNYVNCLLSFAEYRVRNVRNTPLTQEYLSHFRIFIYLMLDSLVGIATYCLNNDKKIIWYEDYFPNMPTEYKVARGQPRIMEIIDSEIRRFPHAKGLMKDLLVKYNV